MTTTGIKITGKDIGYILTILTMTVGFFVRVALLQDQVERNTKELDDNNLDVISLQIEGLEENVDKIGGKMDEALESLRDFIMTHDQ